MLRDEERDVAERCSRVDERKQTQRDKADIEGQSRHRGTKQT